jgi:hypothetical protein
MVGCFLGYLFLFTLADDHGSCSVGMYVMVIGAYIAPESKDNYPAIKVPYFSLVTPHVCPCLLVFLFPTVYWLLKVLCLLPFTENWRFSFCDLCSLILLQTYFWMIQKIQFSELMFCKPWMMLHWLRGSRKEKRM